MWDHLPADQLDPDDETRRLIAEKMAGNAGLGPRRWSQTLMEIRALPEAERPSSP
jgi:hypothetical protein